jgi:hypothetical protein
MARQFSFPCVLAVRRLRFGAEVGRQPDSEKPEEPLRSSSMERLYSSLIWLRDGQRDRSAAGAHVVTGDIDDDSAEAVAREILAEGDNAFI